MSVYRIHENGLWQGSSHSQLISKYGFKLLRFYYVVWQNITNKNDNYLNNMLLPEFKDIIDTYYKNSEFEKLIEVKNTYPEFYEKALNLPSKEIIRAKKHIKNTMLAVKILAALLLIVIVLYLFTIF